jgi:hypothetical protein
MAYSRQQKLGIAMIGIAIAILIFCQFTRLALLQKGSKPMVELGTPPEISVTIHGPEFVFHWPALLVGNFLVCGIILMFSRGTSVRSLSLVVKLLRSTTSTSLRFFAICFGASTLRQLVFGLNQRVTADHGAGFSTAWRPGI